MISRRDFLKYSSASAIMLSTYPGTLGASKPTIKGSAKWTPSICEMCTSACSIEAKVVDGKGVFIRGNKNDKSRGGKICARGGSGFNQAYDPNRLINPIKRVGKRGEGKFKEISWDEAYEEIALKLGHIKEKYGAQSVAFTARSGWSKFYFHTLARAFGSPNYFGHEATCPLAYSMAEKDVFNGSMVRDFANAKYIINMGHNIFEGIVIKYAREYQKAMDNGCFVLSIDPRFSILSSKANEHLAIKPGGDLAFVLGFIYTLINENLYNEDFVNQNCVGFDELKESVKNYKPEVMADDCGISADDIKRHARAFAKFAPHVIFDFGHRVTYNAQELELRRAIMIANALVGAIEVKGGLYYGKNAKLYNSFILDKNEQVPSLKNLTLPPFPKPTSPRIDRIGEENCEFFLAKPSQGITTLVPKAALEFINGVDYKIKAWMIVRNNPLMTYADFNAVKKGILAMDFVVVIDNQISDTAYYADIVLPDTTYLERDQELTASGGKNPNFGIGRAKIIEPIGNSKPTWLIAKELSVKMGLEKYFPYENVEDIRKIQLGENGLLLDKIKQYGSISFGVPLLLRDKKSVANFIRRFPSSKANLNNLGLFDLPYKINLFSQKLQAVTQNGGLEYKPFKYKNDDELYFINGKSAVRTNSATGNNIWLNNLLNEPELWIHPNTAKKLDIKNGDLIEIYNDRSSQKSKALLTLGIREDTVFAYFGFGHVSSKLRFANLGLHSNAFFPTFTGKNSGMDLHVTGVKIKKIRG